MLSARKIPHSGIDLAGFEHAPNDGFHRTVPDPLNEQLSEFPLLGCVPIEVYIEHDRVEGATGTELTCRQGIVDGHVELADFEEVTAGFQAAYRSEELLFGQRVEDVVDAETGCLFEDVLFEGGVAGVAYLVVWWKEIGCVGMEATKRTASFTYL